LTGSAAWTTSLATVAKVSAGLVSAKGAGTAKITATYQSISGSAKVVVSQATLTVTANNLTKPYGAANPTLTYTVTGFATGDTQSSATTGAAKLTTSATLNSQPGTYPIAATAGTLKAANYTFNLVNGVLTVVALEAVTLNCPNATIVYGSSEQCTASGTYSDGTSKPLTGSATWTSSAAGVAKVTAGLVSSKGTGTVSITATYQNLSGSTQLAVNQAVLTVTAKSLSKTYGTPNPALTYSMAGFVSGETQTSAATGAPALSTSATLNSVPGTYPITIAAGTLKAANYAFNLVNGALAIALSPTAPALLGIAPSSAQAGGPKTTVVAYGSNFKTGVAIQWNGKALPTACTTAGNLTGYASCTSATALTATVPAANLSSAATAQVTVVNPSPGGGASVPMTFSILPAPAAGTWVRAVAGVTVPWDEIWDAQHGRLYVSAATQDPANPNTIASIDPVAGKISSTVAAGNDPHLLTISSDSSYLWASLDGSHAVQRFLLPSLAKDISFPLPNMPDVDPPGWPQVLSSLQAAPVNPHTIALVLRGSNGVLVYDDTTRRPVSVPSWEPGGGPFLDFIQWGMDDSTIYGTEDETMDAGGIGTLAVNSSGVSLVSYPDSLLLEPWDSQFDRSNGILYSYAGAYDPKNPSLVGTFSVDSAADYVCTADSSLGRYFCLTVFSLDETDIFVTELLVFDLNTYALIGSTYLGWSSSDAGTNSGNSPISGFPMKLVRWGNAGLALITTNDAQSGFPDPMFGSGGVFLIDGAAINPNAAPDASSGSPSGGTNSWLSSISPQSAAAGSGEVLATITGTGFSPASAACWNCSSSQLQLLPTTYVSPTQLQVVIPVNAMPATVPLEVSVYSETADPFSTSAFSNNALTFTVLPSSTKTKITPLNLSGLAMAWDAPSEKLYVAVEDYDAAYPDSIVAVDPAAGQIVNAQSVESDPLLLSDSAGGQYLYVGYAYNTNMTQLELPSLGSPVTWPLNPLQIGPGPYPAYDLKASPTDPHVTAVTYFNQWGADKMGTAYLGVYDDSILRPDPAKATGGNFEALAWSANGANIMTTGEVWYTGTGISLVQVDSSGATYLGPAKTAMAPGELHSDFGTNLIYSDNGNVADPVTGALAGTYRASGLVAPDSSLNRVFILGQVAAQEKTNSYTIQSFDEKKFSLVSSITLNYLSGFPIEMVRWGASGLAVLTTGGALNVTANSFGMLYLIDDPKFVSNLASANVAEPEKPELVQKRWKRLSKRDVLAQAHRSAQKQAACCR
jgi:tetrahydromethanopterin S-methyltransferase subunit B